MTTPKTFGLKENPFGLVPPEEVKNWAGLQETKQVLGDIISSVRPDDIGSSETIIFLGDYGAGKSHALRYFAHDINANEKGLAIYIGTVKSAASITFASLYPRIIEEIEEKQIDDLCRKVSDAVYHVMEQMKSETGGMEITNDFAIDQKVSKADRAMVKRLCEKGAVPSDVADDFEATQILASLFRVMTTPIGDSPPPYAAVYLFLDEVEFLMEIKAPMQFQFYAALRGLINGINEHFALILSFTAPLSVIESAMPQHILERLNMPPYECPSLSSEDAKDFAKEYLEFARIKGFSPPHPFYPFSEDALDHIFERETALVPRRILKHMDAVFKRSIHREGLQAGEEITQEMADRILTEMRV